MLLTTISVHFDVIVLSSVEVGLTHFNISKLVVIFPFYFG